MQNDPRVGYLVSNLFAYSESEAVALLEYLDGASGSKKKTHSCSIFSTNFETNIETRKTVGVSYTIELVDLRLPPQGKTVSYLNVPFSIEQIRRRVNDRPDMEKLVWDNSARAMKKHKADGNIKGDCLVLEMPILCGQMTDFLLISAESE